MTPRRTHSGSRPVLSPAGGYPYADRVAPQACLLDAFDTILDCDFTEFRSELPALAGIPADAMITEFGRIMPALTAGRLSMAGGFRQILPACGVEPRPRLVRALVSKGRELLLAAARLYDDVLPFLEKLRSRGIAIAIVSNCDENMREVLSELGVSAFADALALSCEVGAAKPKARIYRHALEALGVTAEAALFVDDNAAFCAAGAAVGLSAVQIVRGQAEAKVVPGITVVRSLPEVEAMF
jgi:putative hydrolase of the HAD superfamily